MNKAIIIAGGIGTRVGANLPKQFIEIDGKPILAYTLENFQNHELIDEILVVCLEGWLEIVNDYIKKYGIKKLKYIIPGGATGQESIRNGVFFLEQQSNDNDIIIIHDGVRPLVDDSVLTDVIEKAIKYGNGVTSMPYNEQIFLIDDNEKTHQYIPRETLRRVSTPQAYNFKELSDAYHEAFEKEVGIYGSSYTNTMFCDLGKTLYFAKGSDKNIKLTTPADIEVFKTFIKNRRD